MSKILIFLDIDGVLVPEKKFDRPVPESEFMKFDPDCLNAFENILRLIPEAEIVITSSWREIYSFEVIRQLFSLDIIPRVTGVTPFLDPQEVFQHPFLRYAEVLEYLRSHDLCSSDWVAIDDIPEHYPEGIAIVVTDAYIGFDQQAAQALTNYLSRFRDQQQHKA